MKHSIIARCAAGLCLALLAGCGGESAEEKPAFKTEPYREVGPANDGRSPEKKDGKSVGFQ